ncbi:hypothetical protein [Streptomyces sp. NPDC046685]|uniref:hypothetical protein n=1 Tax=Streptomyces sp. NPDC046685 TaxID=3157202 RepID=UPI0033CCA2D1
MSTSARETGRREVVVRIALPSVSACTAMLGTAGVGAALVHGTVPASSPLAWPLVVLALGAMAYDVGLRAARSRVGDPLTGPSGSGPQKAFGSGCGGGAAEREGELS